VCQPWILASRPIWIADAHRGERKRFVVRADEKLMAFLELEAATRAKVQSKNPAASFFPVQRFARLAKFSLTKLLRP
jgi:hypothetical protein